MLHHAATCQRWKELNHGDVVRRLAFSRTGNCLVSAGRRSLKVWDLGNDELLGLVGRENQDLGSVALGSNTSPSSLVFHLDESAPLLAAAYEDGDICLFDYDALKLIKMIEANVQIEA